MKKNTRNIASQFEWFRLETVTFLHQNLADWFKNEMRFIIMLLRGLALTMTCFFKMLISSVSEISHFVRNDGVSQEFGEGNWRRSRQFPSHHDSSVPSFRPTGEISFILTLSSQHKLFFKCWGLENFKQNNLVKLNICG